MIAKSLMRADFVSVDKENRVSYLIGKLKLEKKTEAVVLDKKKYYGIVCKKKLLKSRMNAAEEKVKKAAVKPGVLNGGESMEDTARIMLDSDAHILPVVSKGMVEGVVYAADVIEQLDKKIKEKRASEFMTTNVIAFHEDTPLGKVINTMHLKKIDHAPIVNEMNKITGVVSAIDLVLKYSIFPMKRPGGHNIRGGKSSPGKPRDLVSLPVINETTTDVVTASPGDRVKKIISLMEEEKISDVIIADDFNEPVGIITIKDLLKLFF
jgi:CBS domain-containing protein